ncbi:restriction endonuclease subunit S [Vagococcus fluvialis]|uniref:restriction endonuclease subunit S n=2 Tax=Vagococcus fluvialis TaxID=2738 RepID=UPI001D0BA7D8|nr:restriction endonuclease subunit S [Vagococcus fluvialis]UDM73464.1 restriction endonuclease subunit S [Vagococcus fluvialis]
MVAWEQRKLGEILQIIDGDRGKNYPSSDDFLELGHTLFLSASNVTKRGFKFVNNQYISEEKSNSMGNGKVKMNDIILTSRGSIGNLALYNSDSGNKFKFLRINSGMLILRPDKFTQSSFILQSLNSQSGEKQIKLISFGSAQPQLTKKDVSNFQIQIPSAGEQIKIGDFFKQLDETITLHHRELELLKLTKKSFLQQLFPDSQQISPNIRFANYHEDWEQRKLGEYVIDYVEKTTVQNQFPVLTSSQKQGIVLQEKYFTNRQVTTDNNIGYYVLPKGYFTFRSRSDNDIFVFNRNDIIDKGIISYFYPVFTLKKADSNFFLKRINNGIQRQLSIQAEGTGQHVLSLKKFKSIVTMFPSIEEQQKIGLLFKQLDETITLQERKLENLKIVKSAFLQKMFI